MLNEREVRANFKLAIVRAEFTQKDQNYFKQQMKKFNKITVIRNRANIDRFSFDIKTAELGRRAEGRRLEDRHFKERVRLGGPNLIRQLLRGARGGPQSRVRDALRPRPAYQDLSGIII